MYEKKTTIFICSSFVLGIITIVLFVMLKMNLYIFPHFLFHSFFTPYTMLFLILFLFFLFTIITIGFFINNKYVNALLVLTGIVGSFMLLFAVIFSTNHNETVFFSSPNDQDQFAVVQVDMLHNKENGIYHMKNSFYAVQIAQVTTNDLENVFSQNKYDLRWHDENQFTIYVPDGSYIQEVDITYRND